MDQLKSKIEARTRVLKQNSPQQLVPQFVNSTQKPSATVHAVHPQAVGAAVRQVHLCDQDGCGKICKSVGGLTLHKNRKHNGKKNGALLLSLLFPLNKDCMHNKCMGLCGNLAQGRFPFDEIFENFGWESNGTGSFPEKIFENLGQPFQCSRKVEISVFSKILVVSSRTV